MKTIKIKFIVEPKDILSDEMNSLKGGSELITCISGKIKCRKNGLVDDDVECINTGSIKCTRSGLVEDQFSCLDLI